jgi:Protein of unknown function (DUF3089)
MAVTLQPKGRRMTRTLRCTTSALAFAVLGAVALTACSSAVVSASSAPSHTASTVWLCRPGAASDPCTTSLHATVVAANGQRTVEDVAAASHTPFDCFYVYPTVSTQETTNANLKVQAAELNVAKIQAAPFSQVCHVWAPMYRQVTLAGLFRGGSGSTLVAYKSVLAGWTDYLHHHNDGRPIVFLGHSQGAAMLIRLLEHQVDANPSLRSRVVAAIILGGNVAVPDGKVVGATFSHLPLCTSASQFGCVIAYSTFPSQPPADSLFGRPGQGVSLQSGQTQSAGLQVACVNPAAIGGGTASLLPWFRTGSETPPPPALTTPWVTYPDLYTASCESSGGATWLQVTDVGASGDDRPVVTETLGPTWGYHLYDVNLATQNLVEDVQSEELAYTAAHH